VSPLVRFDRVSKRYPDGISALSNVSFDIAPGELVVIAGHSGAGKSTLLRLLSAIERPSGGNVWVAGQDVGRLAPRAIPYLRRNMGLVFQDQKLLSDRSAFENVMLPLSIAGFPPREAAQRVNAALDKVGLLQRAQARPVALSGGEQQRLAIARAVVHRPNLLLADEPTAHLDADTAADVVRIFGEFHRVGVTVLVTSCERNAFPSARQIVLDHGMLREAAQ
jgi:cell division transport system ATP-binding protein